MLKRVKASPMVKARERTYWQRLTAESTLSSSATPSLLRQQFGHLWVEHLRTFGLESALVGVIKTDCTEAGVPLLARWDPDKDSVYRVAIDPLTQRVEVTHFGLDSALTEDLGIYVSVHELPKWIQEKLAVLSMMESKPPTTPVEGVGQRINQHTYWLVR